MARAVALVLRHAFGTLGTEAVRWRAYAGNEASWRVAHRCGFPPYVAVPYLLEQRGRWRDGWQSVLTAGQWRAAVG